MRMYLFTATKPNRDGALGNDVVTHELAHGLSNRLTGGGQNANCLQSNESSGLGEGWSDAISIMIEMTPSDNANTAKVMGSYVVNSPNGVRNNPYTTNMTVNKLTYNSLADPNYQEVHNMGEIVSN
jgi:extracellular elastinolytic metalloproteinase